MADPDAATALEAEFDTLMARAGLVIPDRLRPSILAAFADLRGQMALLHGRWPHTAEPAHVFRLPLSGGAA